MGCSISFLRNDNESSTINQSTTTSFAATAAEPTSTTAAEARRKSSNNQETFYNNNSGNKKMDKIDYKSRLEKKMCLAKETPEPDFDLSDCNLKEIPSGVFIHCRILRKEFLNLSNNKLMIFDNINNGGQLNDLSLLTILDLNFNRIKKLPDDIYKLESLRELLISNNNLIQLPKTINCFKYLELLNVAYNNLKSIDEINFIPKLRILNLMGNENLKQLPSILSTCDNLNDLIIDVDHIEWPPIEILHSGTENILKFLTTGEAIIVKEDYGLEIAQDALKLSKEDALIKQLSDRAKGLQTNTRNYHKLAENYYGNEDALFEEIHQKQQKQKEEALKAMLSHQNENESLVNRIQKEKEQDNLKLIKDIMEAEENANLVIEKFLTLKPHLDPQLLEQERLNEEKLLEMVHLEHSELRKQEIVATMSEILQDEEFKLQEYQKKRDEASTSYRLQEEEDAIELEQLYRDYEQNRSQIYEKICEDEELQKLTLLKLIEKNDARSWSLVEQLKIIEIQLAGMTQLELEKKKYSNVEQMNELSDKRIRLTSILMDLLEQQELRKQELFDTLIAIEAQKEEDQQDFWLLQYQKLLDNHPFSNKINTIDPLLGYNFLVNGVIHCLPFLQKLWQNSEINLRDIKMDDLEAVGIRLEKDRKMILKSIQEYLKDNFGSPTAPLETPTTLPTAENKFNYAPTDELERQTSSKENSIGDATLSECVICMEENAKFIFLPCGHMCCCNLCQQKVDICPMCRTPIEKKIKVIQS